MKKTFNFNDIGKRLPYKVPENFFNALEEKVLAEVCKEKKAQTAGRFWRKPYFWSAISTAAIAASVALLLVFKPATSETAEISTQMLDNAFCALSTEDQNCLLDIYQADIFIGNNTSEDDYEYYAQH